MIQKEIRILKDFNDWIDHAKNFNKIFDNKWILKDTGYIMNIDTLVENWNHL